MFAALAGMKRSFVEFGAAALTNALRNASDGDTVVVHLT